MNWIEFCIARSAAQQGNQGLLEYAQQFDKPREARKLAPKPETAGRGRKRIKPVGTGPGFSLAEYTRRYGTFAPVPALKDSGTAAADHERAAIGRFGYHERQAIMQAEREAARMRADKLGY